MDRPGVRQAREGSGKQRQTEETGCEIIRGVPSTLAVRGIGELRSRQIQRYKARRTTLNVDSLGAGEGGGVHSIGCFGTELLETIPIFMCHVFTSAVKLFRTQVLKLFFFF